MSQLGPMLILIDIIMEIVNLLVSTFIQVSILFLYTSIYPHIPITAHLTNSPGLPDVSPQKNAVVDFIQSLQSKPDVWFVSNEQLLQWVSKLRVDAYSNTSIRCKTLCLSVNWPVNPTCNALYPTLARKSVTVLKLLAQPIILCLAVF